MSLSVAVTLGPVASDEACGTTLPQLDVVFYCPLCFFLALTLCWRTDISMSQEHTLSWQSVPEPSVSVTYRAPLHLCAMGQQFRALGGLAIWEETQRREDSLMCPMSPDSSTSGTDGENRSLPISDRGSLEQPQGLEN